MSALPTIAAIQNAVADRHGIPVESMREPRSTAGASRREVVRPRQEAIRLAALLTEHSYVRIGHFFGGRDHSTVINACKRIDVRRHNDPELDQAMKRMTLELIGARP